jgi:imidazolonepropionase-like amidohydrolase
MGVEDVRCQILCAPGWQDHIGFLEKGKYADIVAVAFGDPMQNITELEPVKFVMKLGKVIKNELADPNDGPSKN